MGLFRFLPVAGAWTLVLSLTAPAHADPISITYIITIEDRCTSAGCAAFDAQFPLTMMFDSGLTREEVSADRRTAGYGAPTFSAVPFDRPALVAGATEFRYTLETSFALHAPGLPPFRRVSEARHSHQALTPEFDYRYNLGLFAAADTETRAELSPESFARFLAQGPEDGDPNDAGSFTFGFVKIDRATGLWSDDSFTLRGYAELGTEPSPVPEPATLTLLGTGLAAAAWQRRRRKAADQASGG